MKNDEQQVKKAVEQVGAKIREDENGQAGTGKSMTLMTEEVMKNGHMPKDIFKITDQQMEVLYAQAYNFYQTGRYKDAVQLFRVLVMLNANEVKYSLGLAACFHMMKEYDNAIKVYTVCSILDPESPIPYYHMSDCFISMKDSISAVVALEMAIDRARDKEPYKIIKDRSKITLDGLKEELLKQKNKS